MATKTAVYSPSISELAESFHRSLAAENKSPRTITAYIEALRLFDDFITTQGMPREVSSIRRDHVEAFIADQLARRKPATASNRYRSLQAFWEWCVSEGEIKFSPMENMNPPKVPEYMPPVLSEDDLRRLLKACEGMGFEDRRDMAIVRLLLDTGARRRKKK